MAEYLDKFRGLLKKRQADQVLQLLNKQKNAGQIRTVQEFLSRLDSLIRELNQSVLTPTLKVFMAESNNLVDSDSFNFMLERVQDDLVAGFEEAVQIDEVQQDHEAIVRDVILKNLKFGIAELEAKIALYEFLNKDKNGFDSAIFSTFRESKEEKASRSIEQSSIIFSDPRTGELFTAQEDAAIDLIGERLVSATENRFFIPVRKIRQVFDLESPQSSLIVEPPNVKITNLIDGRQGTFWIQTLLFEENKSSVKVKLELSLANTRDISFIQIEPATSFGVVLEAIHYTDSNDIATLLVNPEQIIDAPVSISFRTVSTKKLILTFRNEDSVPTQFEYSDQDNLFNQSFLEPPNGITPTLAGVSKDLNQIIDSEKTKTLISLPEENISIFKGFAFTTGFDNIRVGHALYASVGSYVSKPLTVEDLGQLGLRTLETRPVSEDVSSTILLTDDTYDTDDEQFFHNSIEYWVIKRDFDSDDNILSTVKFPILPMGVGRIHHESLLLVSKSDESNLFNDQGTTIFFTQRELGEVRVFRNGIELQYAIDSSVTDGWEDETTSTDRTPDTGNPMKFRIKIQRPSVGDIYTVSYMPLTSTTAAIPGTLDEYSPDGLSVVDMIGDLSARLLSTQAIVVNNLNDAIDYSQVFLQIILRGNTANTAITAAVEEYMLVVGQKDTSKFREFGSV